MEEKLLTSQNSHRERQRQILLRQLLTLQLIERVPESLSLCNPGSSTFTSLSGKEITYNCGGAATPKAMASLCLLWSRKGKWQRSRPKGLNDISPDPVISVRAPIPSVPYWQNSPIITFLPTLTMVLTHSNETYMLKHFEIVKIPFEVNYCNSFIFCR